MDSTKACTCSPTKIRTYLQRISGPLLDRVDIHLEAPRLQRNELLATSVNGEDSCTIRARVQRAREVQARRFAGEEVHCNAYMRPRNLKKHCALSESVRMFLSGAIDQLGLSARAFDRIVKLARTIADMEESDEIQVPYVAEAIDHRTLDRKLWQ